MNDNEFVTVAEMIERIKDIVCKFCNGKVLDQDIAGLLRMNHLALATAKKRNTPPVKHIIKFCHRTGLDPMKILF